MGGHQAGDVASRLALARFKEHISDWQTQPDAAAASPSVTVVGATMAAGLMAANEHLVQVAAADPTLAGMGTTLTAVYVRDYVWTAAHVGDSRLYKIAQSGDLVQLTTDHALVAELVRVGQLTTEQARSHPQRNVLTEALGLPRPPAVQVLAGALTAGEGLLLCTDGLTKTMTDDEIAALLRSSPDQPAQLIAAANDRGGPDNITLIVIWPASGGPAQ